MPHDIIDNRSDKLLDYIRTETLKVSETFRVYEAARDETLALTKEIAKVEKEIDARVAALYGVG